MSNKLSLLSLDDDKSFNNILEHFSSKYNYHITTTETAEEFLEAASTRNFDIFVIDLNFNGVQGAGFFLIQTIRKKLSSNIPIFVISRDLSPESIDYSIKIGAQDYLTKPLDETLFESKLSFYRTEGRPKLHAPLEYYLVPETQREAELELSLDLHSVSEEGLYLLSKEYIAKKTLITLSGDFITELFENKDSLKLNVTDFSLSENGGFLIFLAFSESQLELSMQARSWVLGQG